MAGIGWISRQDWFRSRPWPRRLLSAIVTRLLRLRFRLRGVKLGVILWVGDGPTLTLRIRIEF